jgi:excisionase family DNA binding protein
MTDDVGEYVSTRQAAQALGVSVSTVKRWVDDGVLPAHRTAGGHRKLRRAEVLALARQGALPHGDWAAPLVDTGRGRPVRPDRLTADVLTAVRSGDGGAVRDLLRRAYRAGLAVEALADGVVAPVLQQVGRDWEAGRIDVWEEHRSTQLVAAALFELRAELVARAERHRPVAVGGAPEGDPTTVASLLAELVLLDAGWEAVNLGADTPFGSFAAAMERLRPRLLWLSVTHLPDPDRFVRGYRELYRAAEKAGVAVAVGGRVLAGGLRAAIPYTTYGDGLTHLAAFARTLHPRPRRPRRGRPPVSEARSKSPRSPG